MKLNKFVLLPLIIVGLMASVNCYAAKKVLDIEHWTTKNGARVYFVAAKQLPILDVRMAFAAGSSQDGSQNGVASLTNALLNQGSADYDANAIAASFEDVGAQYSATAARDMAVVSVRTLSDPKLMGPALKTFGLVLSQPAFNAKAFERNKNMQLAAIKQQQQSPSAIASKTFYRTLFRQTPYGHPVLGTEQTVAALKASDAEAFYKKHYVAKNAVMAIVGNIDRNQAENIAEQLTSGLAVGQAIPEAVSAKNPPQALIEKIKYPSTQTNIRIGQVGISRMDPDYFPLLVGNYTLGGGALVSRLTNEIREKRGLAYAIYSVFIPMSAKGPFIISLGTRNEQAARALEVTMKTLREFIVTGPTPKELVAAKKNLTGSFVLKLDSNSKIANTILTMGFYKLPLDYLDTYKKKVNAVTVQHVREAFKRHLDPDTMVTVKVGANG